MKIILKILRQPKLVLLQILSFIFLIASNLIALGIAVVSGKWLDEFLVTKSLPENFITIIVISSIVSFIVPYTSSFISNAISEIFAFDLRKILIEKYFTQNYEIYNNIASGKLFTIFTNDVNQIKDILSRVINSLISAVIMLIGSTALMLHYNSKLAISVFIVIPLILVIAFFIIKKLGKYFKKIQKKRDELNKVIEENIKGSMLIRVFASEADEVKKFDSVNSDFKNFSLNIVKYFSLLFPLINMALFIGQLLVLYIGGQSVISGNMSIGDLSTFNMLVIIFTAPFIIISFITNFITQAIVSLKRVNEILDFKITKELGMDAISDFKTIKFIDVSYSIGRTKILKNINLTINKGDTIGIIGTTASGKTTLIKLILGMINPTKGKVLIDDKPLEDIDSVLYQRMFGYVPQSNQLFNETISKNITFYRDLSKENVETAVKTAKVDEFTDKFAEGLKTTVSERGTNLSGGQKQRIVIARALAGNPKILILDDSTAKLDSVTEKSVFNNIKQNYKGLTLINIAAKISSIMNSTKIIILDSGEIRDIGTHEELLKTSYLYQEIELSQNNYHG